MNLKKVYEENEALLTGHFKLSSGKHSPNYLQSAKVLENPKVAEMLLSELAEQIKNYGLKIDKVCSPAIGGLLAGYELARQLGVNFIFAERVNGKMTVRRGFEVNEGEKIFICEDIITTGGSALEAAAEVEKLGGDIVGFGAIANRGLCKRVGSENNAKPECKLPNDLPFFAIDDFIFETYEPENCPLCKDGSEAIKPGSRGN